MNAHKILYKCKLCEREGVAEADLDCPPEWIDKLAPSLCCNICFDSREERMKAEQQIFKACHFLNISTQFKPEQAAKLRSNSRAVLDLAVPAFVEAVCSGHRLQTITDSGFVNDFYSKPDKAGQIMGFYKHKVAEIARTNSQADAGI